MMPARAARRQRLVAGSSVAGDHTAIAVASTARVETPSSHARRCAMDMVAPGTARLQPVGARSVPNRAKPRRRLRFDAFFSQRGDQAGRGRGMLRGNYFIRLYPP